MVLHNVGINLGDGCFEDKQSGGDWTPRMAIVSLVVRYLYAAEVSHNR